jgi:hypothetical protein
MIRVGVGVDLSWGGGDDVVLLLQAGQPQEITRCRGWERSLAIVEVVL